MLESKLDSDALIFRVTKRRENNHEMRCYADVIRHVVDIMIHKKRRNFLKQMQILLDLERHILLILLFHNMCCNIIGYLNSFFYD